MRIEKRWWKMVVCLLSETWHFHVNFRLQGRLYLLQNSINCWWLSALINHYHCNKLGRLKKDFIFKFNMNISDQQHGTKCHFSYSYLSTKSCCCSSTSTVYVTQDQLHVWNIQSLCHIGALDICTRNLNWNSCSRQVQNIQLVYWILHTLVVTDVHSQLAYTRTLYTELSLPVRKFLSVRYYLRCTVHFIY